MSQYLIVSDLDGTLLGDEDALCDFAQWHAERRDRVYLAYSSGRSCTSMAESVRATHLPDPVALIGNVGTEICRYPGGEPAPGWPSAGAPAWSAHRVREVLAPLSRLQMQPDEFQSAYKVSYFLHDAAPHELAEVRAAGRRWALVRAGV